MPRKKKYEVADVLHKAMLCFWKNGYEETSLRLLEQEMGINQFSIYDSFGSKEGLYREVLKTYRNHVQHTFLKDLLGSEGHMEDIRTFLLNYGQAIHHEKKLKGCLMVNTTTQLNAHTEKSQQEVTQYFEFILNVFTNVLSKAQEQKELPQGADIPSMAHFLLVSLQGLSVYAQLQSLKNIETYVNRLMKTLN